MGEMGEGKIQSLDTHEISGSESTGLRAEAVESCEGIIQRRKMNIIQVRVKVKLLKGLIEEERIPENIGNSWGK